MAIVANADGLFENVFFVCVAKVGFESFVGIFVQQQSHYE